MSIARPRRFTSEYGYRAKAISYESRYTWGSSGKGGGTVNNVLADYSYRKVPQSSYVSPDGWRDPTEWAMTSHRSRPGSHSYKTKYYGIVYEVTGDGPRSQGMPKPRRAYDIASGYPVLPTGMSEQTRRAALNNIKDQKIDLGAMFGEADDLLASLGDAIRKLAEAYRYARKGNWKAAGTALGYKGWKTVPNGWLAYYYGFLPVMNDIYGLQEQLKTPFKSEGFFFRAASERTHEMDVEDAVTDKAKSVTGFYRHICKAVYYLKVSDSKLLAASQLGLANPLSMFWEMTTLSFVVDWFIPIGAFLQSFTAHYGTKLVAGYEDRITTYDIKVEGNWGSFMEGSKENYTSELLAFRRVKLTSTVPPNLFSLSSGLSNLSRTFSAAALIVNMRR